MRRSLIAVLMLLFFGTWAAQAEIELGVGLAPPVAEVPSDASGGFFSDSTKVLHAGLSFAWLFYASYDGLILPPYAVSQMTSTVDTGTGSYTPGYFRPGFLNTFDVGFRPRIGNVMILAAVGVNTMYIWHQDQDQLTVPEVGVNLRLGAGLRFGILGIMLSGTTVFADFNELGNTLDGLTSSDSFVRRNATDKILNNLFPVAVLSLYL